MWFGTLEHAKKYNITILKIPPHTTDLLQSLDVAVFKSLKDHWGCELFKRLNATRSRLRKAEFATLLASENVWEKAFLKENIQNEFRKCGIFPCNRDRYTVHRLDKNLKNRYYSWVENIKLPLSSKQLDEMLALQQYRPPSKRKSLSFVLPQLS